MKIFGWMQSKLNGKKNANKKISLPTHPLKHESCKEEFSDWPSGLLAIGTFGNGTMKHPEKPNFEENVSSCQDHQEEITPEEVKQLQKELKLLLHKESSVNCDLTDETEKIIYPPEKFFDSLQTLDDDRNSSELVSDNSSSKDVHLQESNNSVQSSKGNTISKRSLTYLLRKTFLGAGKPKLTPLLRDPVPEIKLDKSRLEKILRAVLKKKIYPQSPPLKVPTKKFLDKICPQSSYPNGPARKCLDNKYESETDSDDEAMDKLNEGSKWVKTDSEFIVLEI